MGEIGERLTHHYSFRTAKSPEIHLKIDGFQTGRQTA